MAVKKSASQDGFVINEGLSSVRVSPTMYLGELGNAMVYRCIKEGVDNCVTGETLVFTEHGIQPIRNFVDRTKSKGSKPYSLVLADADGVGNATHSGHYGIHKTLRLTTKYGHTIRGTYDHPMLSYDPETLTVDYKKLKDIRTGDMVAVKLGANVWASKDFPGITLNKARIIGYLVAEGYFARMLERGSVEFVNKCPEVLRDFRECLQDFNTVERVTEREHNGCTFIEVFGLSFVSELIGYGILPTWKSHKTEIPTAILRSRKETIVEFLRAMYEGDGSAIAGRIEYATKSPKLAKQVQMVLGNFGIFSKIQTTSEHFGNFYKVWITRHKHIFLDVIGFVTSRKNQAVVQYSADEYAIPHIVAHINDLILRKRVGDKKSAWYLMPNGSKKRLRLTNRTTSGENRAEQTRTRLNEDSIIHNISEVDPKMVRAV